MLPPRTPTNFDRGELRRSLTAQNLAKNRNPTGRILRNSNLLFNKNYSQKTLFFGLPPPTVGTLARRTHVEIYLVELSSLLNFGFRNNSGVEI